MRELVKNRGRRKITERSYRTIVIDNVNDFDVILALGMSPDLSTDIISNALDLISNWAMVCGLENNPSKTELIVFTRKAKVQTSTLKNCEIILPRSAKYLCRYRDSTGK